MFSTRSKRYAAHRLEKLDPAAPRSGLLINKFWEAQLGELGLIKRNQNAEGQEQELANAVAAGQLAVGQYASPHTRQSAEIAAKITQDAAGGLTPPINEAIGAAIVEVSVLEAREALGQYFQPHTRQSAETASKTILTQAGFTSENGGQ